MAAYPSVFGYLDGVRYDTVLGWAWTPASPQQHVRLEVSLDGHRLGSVTADAFRADLLHAHIGDGRYGFNFPLPERLLDEKPHLIRVVDVESGIELQNSPQTHVLSSREYIRHLVVETCGQCNLRCVMCPTLAYSQGKGVMAQAVFEKVLGYVRSHPVLTVDLTGWGEPTMDPQLPDRIAQLKACRPDLCVMFSTNASLLTENLARALLKAGVDQITFSCDAASEDMFNAIRCNATFGKCLENVRRLAEFARAMDTPAPKLNAVFVMMRRNVDELRNCACLLRDLGFAKIIVKPLDVLAREEFLDLALSREEVAKVLDEFQQELGDGIQLAPWNLDEGLSGDCLAGAASGSAFVNCNGELSLCCNLGHHVPRVLGSREAPTRVDDSFHALGCLDNAGLDDLYNSPLARAHRKTLRNGGVPAPCRGCNLLAEKSRRAQ